MKTKIISAICLIMIAAAVCNTVNFNGFAAMAAQSAAGSDSAAFSSARSMVVIETTGNQIIYGKNYDEKLAEASTTKIATAITAIEHCKNLDEIVTIPKAATLVTGTSIYLREGERLSVRDLLYGLMLQSGNDAATALALYAGGSVEGFAALMNETAKKCGAVNTNFVNPHGLDAGGHYTTAYDLALITSYALKNRDFKEIVSTKKHNINATENNTARYLANKNRLLNSLEGCIGVKTGFTSKAGRCLVTACERDGLTLVCVVLNCGPMFEESVDLINGAFNEYELFTVLPSYNFVGEINVENGDKEHTKIYNKDGFKIVLKKEQANNIRVKFNYPEVLEAPLFKDQIIGTAQVFNGEELIFTANLYVMESVDSLGVKDKIKNIIDKWF